MGGGGSEWSRVLKLLFIGLCFEQRGFPGSNLAERCILSSSMAGCTGEREGRGEGAGVWGGGVGRMSNPSYEDGYFMGILFVLLFSVIFVYK